MNPIALAIHGGAGTILPGALTPEKEQAYTQALQQALHTGYTILQNGGTALDAVQAAVVYMEDCPLFNAGRGSVYTAAGTHEMDAAIMEGHTLKAGAVSLLTQVKNPVSLARAVMEHSRHVYLCGEGAEAFARHMNLPFETNDYFKDEHRYKQWQQAQQTGSSFLDHNLSGEKKFGTVGAVALDAHGNLAAATSTGGMTNKMPGRIGDTPVIGAGTYANHVCAVSCTGHGELFIRHVVAYDIAALMEYKGLSLQDATQQVVLQKLVAANAEGGLIAVDKAGNIAMPFNSAGMYRACINSHGLQHTGIYR